MSPNPSFAIALEIRMGRIPVRWTVREHTIHDEGGERTERVFWPHVELSKWGDAKIDDMDDPLGVRAAIFRSFRTTWTENAALAMLNRIGAWQIAVDEEPDGYEKTWQEGTFAQASYRHRSFYKLRVVPLTLEVYKAGN